MTKTYSTYPVNAYRDYPLWADEYLEHGGGIASAFRYAIYNESNENTDNLLEMPPMAGFNGNEVVEVSFVVDTNIPNSEYNGHTWTDLIGIGFTNSKKRPVTYSYSNITYQAEKGYVGKQTLVFETQIDADLTQAWYITFCCSNVRIFDYATLVAIEITCKQSARTIKYCINNQWFDCVPYYGCAGEWKQCEMYYGQNEEWHLCSTT